MGIISLVGAQGDLSESESRRSARLLASAFFLGIVLSLVVMGTAAAVLGKLLARWTAGFAIATAVLSILAGAAALLGPAIRRRVRNPEIQKRRGMSGAFAYGCSTRWLR